MRKFILSFIIMFFLCETVVFAVDQKACVYTIQNKIRPKALYGDTTDVSFYLYDGSILGPDDRPMLFSDESKVIVLLDLIFDETVTADKINEKINGKCPPSLVICESEGSVGPYDGKFSQIGFINNTLIANVIFPIEYSFGMGNYTVESMDSCQTAYYNGDNSTADQDQNIEFPCKWYDTLIGNMKDEYCHTEEDDCNVTKIEQYKTSKNEIKNLCNQMVKNMDFSNDCVKKCLKNLKKDISEIEQKDISFPDCSFSEKLANYIANIIKWVKYIIPVIVIVLGILDFIKAIASGKDDEMKKSQGNFIKRLIAAALIFIIPFIIEFVLNVMGFGANGCGIIDL